MHMQNTEQNIRGSKQQVIDTGELYRTVLDPPPADPRVAHPPREEGRRDDV